MSSAIRMGMEGLEGLDHGFGGRRCMLVRGDLVEGGLQSIKVRGHIKKSCEQQKCLEGHGLYSLP